MFQQIIIKSEFNFSHCLGLGHEKTVCTACNVMFIGGTDTWIVSNPIWDHQNYCHSILIHPPGSNGNLTHRYLFFFGSSMKFPTQFNYKKHILHVNPVTAQFHSNYSQCLTFKGEWWYYFKAWSAVYHQLKYLHCLICACIRVCVRTREFGCVFRYKILVKMMTCIKKCAIHYNDVIMGAIASQITRLMIVYSIVYSDADQRKHQRSASLAFVWGIHRGPVNSPHKWPVTRKMFPFNAVIMLWETSWTWQHVVPSETLEIFFFLIKTPLTVSWDEDSVKPVQGSKSPGGPLPKSDWLPSPATQFRLPWDKKYKTKMCYNTCCGLA